MVDQGAQRIGTGPEIARPSGSGLSHFIDHTLLKPDATRAQIVELCQEAREYNFASVCVNPTWVPEVVELLKGSEVLACTVIGFPLGASTTATKAAETREAVATGAQEIDMVINIGRLKSGEYDAVRDDIAAVVQAAAPARVKVIIETCYLSDEEKIKACILSMEARAHFVKTSTGFGSGGATPDDVALMRRVVGPTMGVKASGGIRGYDTARAMIEAGASRLGASASVAIVTGDGKKSGEGY
ncbi:MAG TPA: deoxyribose-phosphate aldolase [Bacteroidetes bacterium]|nr:deoxyribose-phosphate aldolase [Bacteroidota bacterium]